MSYRYYSPMRPLDIATYPDWSGRGDNPPVNVHNFDSKTKVEDFFHPVWGYVEYEKPLTDKEARDYELFLAQ